MSSAPQNRTVAAASRPWRTLGLRLAIWYIATTLGSYAVLAAILPLTVDAWAEDDSQRSTRSALDRYKNTLEVGGTDALRAMFDCHAPTQPLQPSVAIRLSDERNVEIFSASSDDESNHLAATLTARGTSHLEPRTAPAGWHVASAEVSEGRQLELLLHDRGASPRWREARRTALLVLACGLASAILGALIITRRALLPIADLAGAAQRVIDSGDMTLRVQERGTADSLDQLGALLNRMLARNEAIVRAMKESLDNVAHDLRTPLTRLRAGAELGLRDARDPARASEALAEVIEESDRVLAMLTTLMDVTGAETGAMRLDRRTQDLAEIAREAIDLYDIVSSERGVRIVTRLSPGVLVSVDRARIRQVCANLLDNAVKYTAAGGRIEITVADDDKVGVVTVADSGMGISPQDRARIWDRLYRGDRSRTEHGLGLGLSLVKAVVEAHGGEVRLQSEVGVGSTFEVRLPHAPMQPPDGHGV